MTKQTLVTRISSNKWSRVTPSGETVFWQQEDERAVSNHMEAVGMLQRTVNFWAPVMRDQLIERGDTWETAIQNVSDAFRQTMQEKLTDAFPRQWSVKLEDLDFTHAVIM